MAFKHSPRRPGGMIATAFLIAAAVTAGSASLSGGMQAQLIPGLPSFVNPCTYMPWLCKGGSASPSEEKAMPVHLQTTNEDDDGDSETGYCCVYKDTPGAQNFCTALNRRGCDGYHGVFLPGATAQQCNEHLANGCVPPPPNPPSICCIPNAGPDGTGVCTVTNRESCEGYGGFMTGVTEERCLIFAADNCRQLDPTIGTPGSDGGPNDVIGDQPGVVFLPPLPAPPMSSSCADTDVAECASGSCDDGYVCRSGTNANNEPVCACQPTDRATGGIPVVAESNCKDASSPTLTDALSAHTLSAALDALELDPCYVGSLDDCSDGEVSVTDDSGLCSCRTLQAILGEEQCEQTEIVEQSCAAVLDDEDQAEMELDQSFPGANFAGQLVGPNDPGPVICDTCRIQVSGPNNTIACVATTSACPATCRPALLSSATSGLYGSNPRDRYFETQYVCEQPAPATNRWCRQMWLDMHPATIALGASCGNPTLISGTASTYSCPTNATCPEGSICASLRDGGTPACVCAQVSCLHRRSSVGPGCGSGQTGFPASGCRLNPRASCIASGDGDRCACVVPCRLHNPSDCAGEGNGGCTGGQTCQATTGLSRGIISEIGGECACR